MNIQLILHSVKLKVESSAPVNKTLDGSKNDFSSRGEEPRVHVSLRRCGVQQNNSSPIYTPSDGS